MITLNSCSPKSDTLGKKALTELETTLRTQQEFIKVHAGEYLISLGHIDEVKKEFLHENELHSSQSPYRIGIWRVLTETGSTPEEKQEWINKIFGVFGDMKATDRLHATETLAKLQLSPAAKYPEATQQSLTSDSRNMQVYALWATSYTSEAELKKNREKFLALATADSNTIIRRISAYILRKIQGLTLQQWKFLAAKAVSEPDSTGFRSTLLNTAYVTFPRGLDESAMYTQISGEIRKDYQHLSAAARIELAQTLAEKGGAEDLELLTSFLKDENSTGIYEPSSKEGADVRAAAAFAILKIKGRSGQQKN